VVERTLIRPPSSKLGPLDVAARTAIIAGSPLAGKYETVKDRESAFEILQKRAQQAAEEAEKAEVEEEEAPMAEREYRAGRRYSGTRIARSSSKPRSRSSRSDSIGTTFAKSFARQLGTKTGQAVVRGVLGGLFRGR
jgi:hypothetical protein